MAFVECNNNPYGKKVGDCVIRAIALALYEDWDKIYAELALEGYALKDMPSANYVWGNYLTQRGFVRQAIPNFCPDCYTVRDFCEDHPYGIYILATGTHVVCCRDGDWWDTWDSSQEVPMWYWEKSYGV